MIQRNCKVRVCMRGNGVQCMSMYKDRARIVVRWQSRKDEHNNGKGSLLASIYLHNLASRKGKNPLKTNIFLLERGSYMLKQFQKVNEKTNLTIWWCPVSPIHETKVQLVVIDSRCRCPGKSISVCCWETTWRDVLVTVSKLHRPYG